MSEYQDIKNIKNLIELTKTFKIEWYPNRLLKNEKNRYSCDFETIRLHLIKNEDNDFQLQIQHHAYSKVFSSAILEELFQVIDDSEFDIAFYELEKSIAALITPPGDE